MKGAKPMNIIETYENLPKILKVILQLFFGGIIGIVYRIIRFLDSKNTMTLIGAILLFVPVAGFVIQIIDIVTEITKNRITVLAD